MHTAGKRRRAFSSSDVGFLLAVATEVTAIVRMAALVDDLERARDDTVLLLAAASEAHDGAMGTHLRNVQALSEALARELGYSEEDARQLGLAAVLHDVGKVRVPDAVLSAAGELGSAEWDTVRRHTVWGEEFLSGRRDFQLAATIARSHHERWDGAGYPDGLSGEAIPAEAAIVAVADAYDAMTSHRSYRSSVDPVDAVAEIEQCSGTQFRPTVVDALVRLWRRGALPESLREHRAAA